MRVSCARYYYNTNSFGRPTCGSTRQPIQEGLHGLSLVLPLPRLHRRRVGHNITAMCSNGTPRSCRNEAVDTTWHPNFIGYGADNNPGPDEYGHHNQVIYNNGYNPADYVQTYIKHAAITRENFES